MGGVAGTDHRRRSGCSRRELGVLDAADGRLFKILRGHDSGVGAASFSPDGGSILTASGDGTARIWDTGSGALLHTLYEGTEVTTAVFSPDGKSVLTASVGWTKPSVGCGFRSIAAHAHRSHRRDSDRCLQPRRPRGHHRGADHSARIWETGSGELLHVLRHEAPVRSVAYSPDGSLVATVDATGVASIWTAGGEPVRVLQRRTGAIVDAAFSPDGAEILTTGCTGSAELWATATGDPLHASLSELTDVRR